jgi:hypothetical protein
MKRIIFFAVLPLLWASMTGCLERKETIRVMPDGSARMLVELSGDPEEFDGPDALPTAESGWKVADRVTRDDNDKPRRERRAERSFARGEELPVSYAAPGTEEHAAALWFPTEVTVERRPDGMYYHFRRTYVGRPFAKFEVLKKTSGLEQAIKAAEGVDPEQYTAEQRTALLEGMRAFEGQRTAALVDEAVAAAGVEWPQDYGLKLRQAVLDHFLAMELAPVLEKLSEPPSPERDAAVQRYADELLAGGDEALERAVAELPVPGRERAAVLAAMDAARAHWAVTEDIGDERWEVRVELPGKVIGHNGTRDGEAIKWEFVGEALRDRDEVLMATSVVARDAAARHLESAPDGE